MEVFVAGLLLLLALAIILAGAELFTNGIEWFGKRLDLGEGAVGSVLAAVGTAMPETLIPIIAILFGGGKAASHALGIGAILGAPLMLSTLAFFVTGFAVLIAARKGRRGREMTINVGILGRDLRFFFLIFPLAIVAAFIPPSLHALKIGIAIFLPLAYGYYVWRTLSQEGDLSGHLRPLHFHRNSDVPHLKRVILQIVVALVAIIAGARIFVDNMTIVAGVAAAALHMPPTAAAFLLSAVITPIATELPEKFNSVTWVFQKKDTLAMGNISGAMVFQSAIPVSIGILMTEWTLGNDPRQIAAAVTAILSTFVVWFGMRKRGRLSPYALMAGALFYAAFLTYAFSVRA